MTPATEHWWKDAEHDPIHAAAAEWFTRLQSRDLRVEDTTSWQEWMGSDPRHSEAFRRLEEVWRDAALIEDDPPHDRFRYDPDVSVSQWKVSSRRRRIRMWSAAAAVVCAVTASAWYLLIDNRGAIETAVGENRSVKLSDGSLVALGGASGLRIQLSRDSRTLRLEHGEGFFTVAKDATRPFRVVAGNTIVTALGTAFDVRLNSGNVTVVVVEGRVAIEHDRSADVVALTAGEKTVVAESNVSHVVRVPNAAAATAWQSGRLTFDHQALREVLEDVNRYSSKPIVAASADIGDLMITGTVLSDNVEGWVASIENAFGLRAQIEGERIVLTQADEERDRSR